ncbi:MAG: hypothetical protein BM485_18085 [Desulfobulbaceae bacterium DB1]|nr:MAG: hypothetical protein BM485_18085 [Desulfobulbaceae bacterium DB1]
MTRAGFAVLVDDVIKNVVHVYKRLSPIKKCGTAFLFFHVREVLTTRGKREKQEMVRCAF